MKIYKITFADYSEDYFFSAPSLTSAKKKGEKWAKDRNELDGEEYKEIDSINFELETEN